jgi:amino-acid N-acetyltransferase
MTANPGENEMPEIGFTFAEPTEEDAIRKLLRGAELPDEDIARHLRHFLVAKQNGILIGTIGLETREEFGLLRSLVVSADHRNQGLGQKLCTRMFTHAHELGIKKLYLLTTTAENFFPKLGFSITERDNVPDPIQATEEFSSICPSTAVCMVKELAQRT